MLALWLLLEALNFQRVPPTSLTKTKTETVRTIAEACQEEASALAVFQPYTNNHLRSVADCLKESGQSVPIFLIAGNYGGVVSAVGLLNTIEYSDEMPDIRKKEISKLIANDEGLYALNVLSVTNISFLRQPLPLSFFAKVSNEEPLSPGQWPASVCYFLNLSALISAI